MWFWIVIGLEVLVFVIAYPIWLAWPWIGPQRKGK